MRFALITLIAFLAIIAGGHAQERKANELTREARDTVLAFAEASEMAWLRENFHKAKGVVIAPQVLKAGFIFGGSGGNAVFLARNGETWSNPAFYTLGSATFGFQIGAEAAEIILLVMTERGVDSLLTTDVKLGGDLSITAGPVGAGAKAQTADILAFSRSKGLYGGINLEGGVVKVRKSWNKAFYGGEGSPRKILYGSVSGPRSAQDLRASLQSLKPES